jgi:uncharacterized protein (UPF0332 family)
MTTSEWLDRARQDLDAAQLLAEGHHTRPAVSRAYYAAFYAAKAALDSLGEERSKHSAVVAAFVVKRGGGDPAAGRALNDLFDSRTWVDYGLDPMPESDAPIAIDRAKVVVDAVEAWLESK